MVSVLLLGFKMLEDILNYINLRSVGKIQCGKIRPWYHL